MRVLLFFPRTPQLFFPSNQSSGYVVRTKGDLEVVGVLDYEIVKIFGNSVKITWNGQNRANDRSKQNMKMITKCKFGIRKFGIRKFGCKDM